MRVGALTTMQAHLAAMESTVGVTIRIGGHPTLASIRAATVAVAGRHEALRTTVALSDGVQRVHEDAELAVRVIELQVGEEGPLAALAGVTGTAVANDVLPVLNCWVAADATETFLHLATPHALLDRVSATVVAGELLDLLDAAERGVHATLPAAERQFVDFVEERHELVLAADRGLDDGFGARAQAFWSRQLADARPPRWSYPKLGDATPPSGMSFTCSGVPAELTAGLRQVAAAARCSVSQICLAAFEEATSLITTCADVVTLCVSSGRLSPNYFRTVGPLLEHVPIRRVVRADSRRDYLDRVADDAYRTFGFQRFPLEAVPAVAAYEQRLRRRRLAFQFRPEEPERRSRVLPCGWPVEFLDDHDGWAESRMPGVSIVSVDDRGDTLDVSTLFDPTAWDGVEMSALQSRFVDSCRAFLDLSAPLDPSAPLGKEAVGSG